MLFTGSVALGIFLFQRLIYNKYLEWSENLGSVPEIVVVEGQGCGYQNIHI